MSSFDRAEDDTQQRALRAASESASDSLWTDVDDDMEYEDTDDTGEDESGIEFEIEEVTEESDSRDTTEEPGDGAEDEGEQTEREEQSDNGGGVQRMVLTLEDLRNLVSERQFLQILGQAGVRRLFSQHGGISLNVDQNQIDDDDDDDMYSGFARRRRTKPRERYVWPPLPYPEGSRLLREGIFGTNEVERDTVVRRHKKLAYRTMMRELGLETPGIERARNRLITQEMIPKQNPDVTISFSRRGYQGQFSDDGNFFFTCSQDFKVRMYDTSNPYRWRYYKQAPYHGGQWTITDASLSPDNRLLAYSSIRPQVCLANTDPDNTSDPLSLDFGDTGVPGQRYRGRGNWGHSWGIWSLRFSGDGREIVAGTSDNSIYVYDLEAGHSILRIPGHSEDVNAVCYGDQSSPHILYSGSDDTTIKVWDRRSLGDGREAGVFIGHTEGITYVDSKGDGRYVLSNSKDQTMKLWDLRKMIAPEKAEENQPQEYCSGFDYRYPEWSEDNRRVNPMDCSLVTFRGHSVLSTLIRCHFSPKGSTDGRYVYSGSHDGRVYIWNLDGTLKTKLNVSQQSQSRLSRYHPFAEESSGGRILRDVSWHPYAPIIATTSWGGSRSGGEGSTTVHSWSDGLDSDEGDDPPLGVHVTSELSRDPYFDDDDNDWAPTGRARRAGGGGATSTRTTRAAAARRAAAAARGEDDEDEDLIATL